MGEDMVKIMNNHNKSNGLKKNKLNKPKKQRPNVQTMQNKLAVRSKNNEHHKTERNILDEFGTNTMIQTEEQLVKQLELTKNAFDEMYYIQHETVGSGAFAKVRKVSRKRDRYEFALKIIKKKGRSKEELERFEREICILSKLRHRNVVQLINWSQTTKRIFMVQTLCNGGDVFQRLLDQKTLNEKETANVVRRVAEGLKYIHDNNIVHRDIKPDNLMFVSQDPLSNVMIIDFGLAAYCNNAPLWTPCGSAHYVAPEVLSSKGYGCKADMWSLGVITYMLLSGIPPFFDADGNQRRLYKMIKMGKYRFSSPYWDHISYFAKDLITNLLQIDPNKRFSAEQVLQHKWIKIECNQKYSTYSMGISI